VIVIMIFLAIGNGIYIQEHLNRIWDRAARAGSPSLPSAPPRPISEPNG
jgi:hypothetical protein